MRRAVYAGSFDPITLGHLWMIEQGSRLFEELIVAVGVNPDKRYTFSLDERLAVLREVTAGRQNVRVASYENLFLVHYARQVGAAFILRGIRNEQDYAYERGMRYVNEEFDAGITTAFLIPPRPLVEISSNFVKGLVGPAGWEGMLARYVPPPVCRLIHQRHLAAAWDAFVRRAGLHGGDAADSVRRRLFSQYGQPGRHYHTLDHVRKCLAELDRLRDRCRDPAALEAAVWFHDCVYDPTHSDNEERSAEAAAAGLREMGATESLVRKAADLILATKHVSPPADEDAKLLVDIDLAILGAPASEFDAYERAIRQEYAHVSDEAFRRGRAQVLGGFLARPFIYTTIPFREVYEAPARGNLERSLANLAEF